MKVEYIKTKSVVLTMGEGEAYDLEESLGLFFPGDIKEKISSRASKLVSDTYCALRSERLGDNMAAQREKHNQQMNALYNSYTISPNRG